MTKPTKPTKPGPKPKTAAEHITAGTLRPDRHARVGSVTLTPRTAPDLADGLTALVADIAENPPPWLTVADRPALRLLHELAAERDDLLAESSRMPPPPDARRNLRAIGAEIAGLMHALGLTAYGRNRLGVVIAPKSEPNALDLIRQRRDARLAAFDAGAPYEPEPIEQALEKAKAEAALQAF